MFTFVAHLNAHYITIFYSIFTVSAVDTYLFLAPTCWWDPGAGSKRTSRYNSQLFPYIVMLYCTALCYIGHPGPYWMSMEGYPGLTIVCRSLLVSELTTHCTGRWTIYTNTGCSSTLPGLVQVYGGTPTPYDHHVAPVTQFLPVVRYPQLKQATAPAPRP